MTFPEQLGIIGGSGQLGGAIARGLLRAGAVSPRALWIANRSGSREGFEDWPDLRFTTSNQELVDACGLVLLSVPPHLAADLGIDASGRLVASVMAGVTIEAITGTTGANRVVRGMSSPAAEAGLAYSPWCASAAVTDADRRAVCVLFGAIGLTDEVPDEDQIDRFTALTGPVPGFVACFADSMLRYAVARGIAPDVAERAIRQLFKAGGAIMSESEASPGEHVQEMIDYAGTTAAGLLAMRRSSLDEAIARGLDAAYDKARTIA